MRFAEVCGETAADGKTLEVLKPLSTDHCDQF